MEGWKPVIRDSAHSAGMKEATRVRGLGTDGWHWRALHLCMLPAPRLTLRSSKFNAPPQPQHSPRLLRARLLFLSWRAFPKQEEEWLEKLALGPQAELKLPGSRRNTAQEMLLPMHPPVTGLEASVQ